MTEIKKSGLSVGGAALHDPPGGLACDLGHQIEVRVVVQDGEIAAVGGASTRDRARCWPRSASSR